MNGPIELTGTWSQYNAFRRARRRVPKMLAPYGFEQFSLELTTSSDWYSSLLTKPITARFLLDEMNNNVYYGWSRCYSGGRNQKVLNVHLNYPWNYHRMVARDHQAVSPCITPSEYQKVQSDLCTELIVDYYLMVLGAGICAVINTFPDWSTRSKAVAAYGEKFVRFVRGAPFAYHDRLKMLDDIRRARIFWKGVAEPRVLT